LAISRREYSTPTRVIFYLESLNGKERRLYIAVEVLALLCDLKHGLAV
jgi:hypothetical protein